MIRGPGLTYSGVVISIPRSLALNTGAPHFMVKRANVIFTMSDKKDGQLFQQYLPGRPAVFKTVEEMQARIDEYFDWSDARIQQVYSKKADAVIEINNPAPYTMAGLARAIGLSRQALLAYKKRKDENGKDFIVTIKAARVRVQEDVEMRLMESAATGAIFNLKNNFGYQDKREEEHSGAIEVITRKHSSSQLPENTDAEDED